MSAEDEIRKMVAQVKELAECYTNTQPIRERITSIETRLRELVDEDEIESFQVVCNEINNTPDMVDNGIDFKFLTLVKHDPGTNFRIYSFGYDEQELARLSGML